MGAISRTRTVLSIAIAALSVAACGGGGGGGGSGAAPTPPDLAFDSLAPKRNTLTDDDIRHFLGRTQFGVTTAAADELRSRGLSNYVDGMLADQPDPAFEAAALDASVPLEDRLKPNGEQLERWWLWIMMNTEQPFREVLAMFWHDHFATSTDVLDESERRWYFDHVALLRNGSRGSFRQLLFDVAVDRTMLDWLDGFRSRKGSINENFGREFWELFTLGAGNGYTQQDIEESARCFTGFDDQDDPLDDTLRTVVYDPTRHDEGDKMIFGLPIVGRLGDDAINEYWDVIDLTLTNRPVAEFIVTKLWEYFVYLDPPQELIDDLAASFRSDWDLQRLYARIFKSEAFFSTRAKEGIVKSPTDYGVGFVRTTGLAIEPNRLEDGLTAAGQRPTRPPNVAGWEQNALWLSAQFAVERANLVQDCITRRDYQQNVLGYDLATLLPPGFDANTPPTSDEVVDHLSLLLDVDLTTTERGQLVTYLDTDREDDQIVADPFDATNPTDVDERVRGLLYVLSQHPTYHVR